jgi:hypothetical protein
MGQLPSYNSFSEKNEKFSQDQFAYRIDTIDQFDEWYNSLTDKIKQKSEKSKIDYVNTDNMFRGMGEAKHKLLTSSQRFWITNELEQWWRPKRYLEFIKVFVDNARSKLLFRKVFEYYRLTPNQRDFPLLSILQHYGAPTPLMDWSYNLDVALFFATEKASPSYSSNDIDHYFSVYQIDKKKQRKNEFNNLLDWSQGSFPQISSFYEWENNHNSIFYISDFEDKRIPTRSFIDERPITTFYNQNIIPQEGLFIFNPFPTKPLEDCFNTDHLQNGNNLELIPFTCYNIKKDLGEYIRRKIKLKGVDNRFIYPNLKDYCQNLIEEFLDQAAKR